MNEFRQFLIETLRNILKTETANDRIMLLNQTLNTLKFVQGGEELSKKLEDFKQKITLYAGDTLKLAEEIKNTFPDLYPEIIQDPDLAVLMILSKTAVKYYMSGKIVIYIYFGDGKMHKFAIKRSNVSNYIKSRYSEPDKIKWIVDPLVVNTLLEEMGIKVENIEMLTKSYNDFLVELIKTSYKNPLPFENEEEEDDFEMFKIDLADYEHVYRWEDREKVIELLPIDPRHIIFVDSKYVYIPTKWLSNFINARKMRKILNKLLRTQIKTFKTSYIKDREKFDVYYFIIPKRELQSKLNIPIIPRDIKEVVREEAEETEEIVQELIELEKEQTKKQKENDTRL